MRVVRYTVTSIHVDGLESCLTTTDSDQALEACRSSVADRSIAEVYISEEVISE